MDQTTLACTVVPADRELGWLGMVATARGICLVRWGDDEHALEAQLSRELPFARIRRDDDALAAWAEALLDLARGRPPRGAVPLDVRASQLQRRVWKEIRGIPPGETRSYGELARAVGVPRGARAIARACATNPVPLAIPCHRVVEKSGGSGGYVGGIARKRELLRREALGAALEARVP